ncbi:hypothetical protein EBT31_01665 [bacterium]|nr:hypothetical protein [bacterium]NBX48896.1 hypothetical protein [bacterium]
MSNLDSVSGTEMQRLIVNTMKELMWVASGTVVMEREQKQEMVDKAYQLVQKFQRDFVVN